MQSEIMQHSRYLKKIFKSNYCKFVFLLSLILVIILIFKKIFSGYYTIIGVLFILVMSLLLACFVRNIKEKSILAKSQKGSIISILFSIIIIPLYYMDYFRKQDYEKEKL